MKPIPMVFDQASGKNWIMYLGDSCQVTRGIPSNSVGLSVYSPPFKNLYIYSDSEADMGNAADDEEFFEHYEFLIQEKYRITAPGRLSVVHCKDLPTYMNRDGAAGLADFPGRIIQAHLEFDKPKLEEFETVAAYKQAIEEWEKQPPKWQFHSRVTIWKDPVTEMERTKNHGLLHKNFLKETNACRQGMADYLLVFRKYPLDEQEKVTQARVFGDYIGENPPTHAELLNPRRSPETNYSIAVWQRYASPVWFDINQRSVLNYEIAKGDKDEKHICPLQLDVIARSVDLWSNKGDTVFSPFAGIGSEGFEAVKLHRKFVGIELKPEYFKHAVRNLEEAERLASQKTLFDLMPEGEAM